MRSFKCIRLAALGAALAGAAIGATPATAAPGTTCTFDPVTRTATVLDRSGGDRMDVAIENGFITADGNQLCISSGFEFATPTNTDRIEIEIKVLDDPGVLTDFTIFGTSGDDTIRAGGHGRIGFGVDDDVDVTALQMRTLFVEAEGGNDFLSARVRPARTASLARELLRR